MDSSHLPQEAPPKAMTFSAGAGTKPLEAERYAEYIAAWLIVIVKGDNLEDAPSAMHTAAMATIKKLGDRTAQFRIEAWAPADHLDGILTVWRHLDDRPDATDPQLAQTLVNLYCDELIHRGFQLVPA